MNSLFFLLTCVLSTNVFAADMKTVTIEIYDKGLSREARILPEHHQIFPSNEVVSDYLETLDIRRVYTCTAAVSPFTKDADSAILYRIQDCK